MFLGNLIHWPVLASLETFATMPTVLIHFETENSKKNLDIVLDTYGQIECKIHGDMSKWVPRGTSFNFSDSMAGP
jgi:hypothetical protein